MPENQSTEDNHTQNKQSPARLSRRQFIQSSTGSLLAVGSVSAGAHLLSAPATAATTTNNSTDCESPSVSPNEMLARYQTAMALEQGRYGKSLAFNTFIRPHWIGSSNLFWYVRDSKNGKSFQLVDAEQGSNQRAFDHTALANSLGSIAGKKVNADNLPISDVTMTLSPRTVSFFAYDAKWQYRDDDKTCRKLSADLQQIAVSPNGKKAVFVRDYNLWLRDLGSGAERPLTTDGERYYHYAGTTTVIGRQESITLEAIWSADSKRVFTIALDTREVLPGPPLVEHVPTDGSLRPKLIREDRRVAWIGDEHVEGYRFVTIDVDSGKVQPANYPLSPVTYPCFTGFFTGIRGWWDRDNRHAWFIDHLRGGKTVRLLKLDAFTGTVETVIEDQSNTPIPFIPSSHLKTLMVPIPETDELIWFSERSGWLHFYLYNLKTGKLKNPVTQGNWLVRNVLHFDALRRELVIQTACRVKGRNPYLSDICRVNIDTGELTEVKSDDNEYSVSDGRTRMSSRDYAARGVSPGGDFVVATRSRVDKVPVTLLLDRNGRELMTLETADVSGLPNNWQWPEPVMLKTADGKYDTSGVIFRPSHFDPGRSYPVLDASCLYTPNVGSFNNDPLGNWGYFWAAAYAELGFIVVKINNRGNEIGYRNKEFNDYRDPELRQAAIYNKADCVAGIKQLAERYPYMDLNRVGVVEFFSNPTAVAGLFIYPDFYKVGVTMTTRSDLRLYGALGMYDEDKPALEDYAGNLKGKLLFCHGMMDDVMPVAMVFRIIEALQNANKDFDMVLLPNSGHNGSGYLTRRAWDYVVQHLLGEKPPQDFHLVSGLDLLMARRAKASKEE